MLVCFAIAFRPFCHCTAHLNSSHLNSSHLFSSLHFFLNFQCELCELYPFAGGNYAFVRVTFGRFAAFIVGCLDVLQYAFMTFLSVGWAANALRSALYLAPVFIPIFGFSIYAILAVTLSFASRRNSLPTVFIGFAVFMAVVYLVFVFGTIPQMDSEKWLNNYEEEDAPSFGVQFLSSLTYALFLTRGFSAAFLLCDKVAEVRYLLLDCIA
jgi:amino acid transporter